MLCVAPCYSINLSTDLCACQSEKVPEVIPQGSVTIFPACTAIKHAVAGAVTVKESD